MWQARSRDILLMQIRHGAVEREAHWFSFIETVWVQKFLLQATRPLSLAMMIILAVFGGSIMSIRAANQTMPGDPLYIAKIISEKAQFALTFDNTKKAKLNLTFAANRAQELKKMETSKVDNNEHAEKVEELTNEIRTELAEAKARISKITPVASSAKQESKKPEAVKPVDKSTAKVATAVIEKDKAGIDFYDPRQAALEQAKNLIEKKDYNAAADQIKILNEAIDQPEKLTPAKASSSDIKIEKLEKGTSTTE